MRKFLFFVYLMTSVSAALAQNMIISSITKFYYYKTPESLFSGKRDSLSGTEMEYNYGKLSYRDSKTGKKISFHLHKDSAFFAVQIAMCKNGASYPIYAINGKQKHYGVFFGGDRNLFCVLYSRGNFNSVTYNQQNYVVNYFGTVDEFGYSLVFTKANYIAKKNGDIEFFLEDKPALLKKYLAEREAASTYNWNKNWLKFQLSYMQEHNSN